jgi:hypothetical protein
VPEYSFLFILTLIVPRILFYFHLKISPFSNKALQCLINADSPFIFYKHYYQMMFFSWLIFIQHLFSICVFLLPHDLDLHLLISRKLISVEELFKHKELLHAMLSLLYRFCLHPSLSLNNYSIQS